jgi:hypothetical protein
LAFFQLVLAFVGPHATNRVISVEEQNQLSALSDDSQAFQKQQAPISHYLTKGNE